MQKLVKPVGETLVRAPETKKHLPPEGRIVVWSTYWEQQLQDGAITASDPTAEDEAATDERN